MSEDPDIIISISGAHRSKGIVAAILARALKEKHVHQIAHLNYDQETFSEMSKIINEADESGLDSATVLFVEFEEDYIDEAFNPGLPSQQTANESDASVTAGNENNTNEQDALRD